LSSLHDSEDIHVFIDYFYQSFHFEVSGSGISVYAALRTLQYSVTIL